MAGHTALEMPTLTAALAQRGVPDADTAVQSTLAEGEALVFQDALDEPGAPVRRDDEAEEDEERPGPRPGRPGAVRPRGGEPRRRARPA